MQTSRLSALWLFELIWKDRDKCAINLVIIIIIINNNYYYYTRKQIRKQRRLLEFQERNQNTQEVKKERYVIRTVFV